MRVLNVVFEDEEYEFLLEAKEKQSWRQFLLQLINKEEKDGKKI